MTNNRTSQMIDIEWRQSLGKQLVLSITMLLINLYKFKQPLTVKKLLFLSNRPQVSMVYRLINHTGCWLEHEKNCKSGATGELFMNSLSVPAFSLSFQVPGVL